MIQILTSHNLNTKYLRYSSSRGDLGVERWSDNGLHSARVDQIPLGETIPAISMFYVYMVPTPTDVCYKYR